MHQLVFFLLGPISFCGKLNGPATSQRKWKVYVIFAMKMNNSPSEIFNNQIVKEKERRDTITANVIMHHFRQVILGKPLFEMCLFFIWALPKQLQTPPPSSVKRANVKKCPKLTWQALTPPGNMAKMSAPNHPGKPLRPPIPDICHFFYTVKFFGEKNLHRKTPIFRVKSVKNATFSRKICRKCQFFALNL